MGAAATGDNGFFSRMYVSMHFNTDSGTNPTVDALARGRQTMLIRASQLMGTESIEVAPRDDTVPALAGLLMSSLEELKVAEEELREQNERLSERRLADERRLRHYQQLFLHLPAPALLTDLNARVLEGNLAALDLFRREGRYLEGKPFAALLETASRGDFRRHLALVVASGDTRSFPLVLMRVGNVPLEVRATVSVVPGLGPTGSGALFWVMDRPVEED
jgi:PAS domain-containing protein